MALGDGRVTVRAQYRMGQGGIVELLDAAEARTEAELAGVELVESVVQAEVDLLGAAGALDAVIS